MKGNANFFVVSSLRKSIMFEKHSKIKYFAEFFMFLFSIVWKNGNFDLALRESLSKQIEKKPEGMPIRYEQKKLGGTRRLPIQTTMKKNLPVINLQAMS